MPVLHFYSRQGCHLCEIMLEELLPIIRGKAEIEMRNVDTQDEWLRKYDIRVPVIEANGLTISEYPLDREAISRFLDGSALDGAQ